MKTCMYCILLTNLLVVSAISTSFAQTVEHWWLPERYSSSRNGTMMLHEEADRMVCMSINDSSHTTPWPPPYVTTTFKALNCHIVEGNGALESNLLRSIGPMDSEDLYRIFGSFDYAVGTIGSGSILVASTDWHVAGACIGSHYRVSGLRVQYFKNGAFHSLIEFPVGRNPDILQIDDETTWLAWESVTELNPPEFLDRNYKAEVRVARISPANGVQLSFTLGPGYNPHLVQRADGTVFIVYRTGNHAEATDSLGIRLTAITTPGGGDAEFNQDLSFSHPFHPLSSSQFKTFATKDNRLLVFYDRLDSVVVFTCTSDGKVRRSEAAAAGNETQQRYLLSDADGGVILVWRRTAGEDITWSSLTDDRMFDSIRSIPGTASFMEWKAFSGMDGKVKYIAHPTGSDSLLVIPNVTSTASTMRFLFSPPVFWGAVLDWTLDKDDALWIAHRQEVRTDSWQTGLYRVRDLSLPSTSPPALVESPTLYPNSPNPFTSSTTLRYSLPTPMQIHLLVHDALGREIRRFGDDGVTAAGMHTVHLETAGLLPGVYFFTLIAGGQRQTGKMVLL